MIYIERIIKIRRNNAKIEEPIVLYKGDMNIELQFTIENNPFKYKSGIDTTYGQLVITRPEAAPIFSEPAKLSSSRVLFIVTGDMIDELEEIGDYDFQIQLLNADMTSKGSLPPVYGGIIIKKPLCEPAAASRTYVNNERAVIMPASDDTALFDEDGNYNKTNWSSGDIITDAKLNRVEDALYEINDSVPTDYASTDYVDDMIRANNGSLDGIYIKAEDLDKYATQDYVTESIDNIGLDDYATRDYVNDVINNNNVYIEGYVDDAIGKIEIPDAEVDLTGYATEVYVNERLGNYAKVSYVDEAIANIDISGGGDILVIEGALYGSDFTKDEWQSDTGIAMKLVQMNDVSLKYIGTDGESHKTSLQGFHTMMYLSSESILAINELQTTKAQLFMVDTKSDEFTLLEEWYAWEDVEPEHEVATKEYVDDAIANIDIPDAEVDLTGYATEDYVNTIDTLTRQYVDNSIEKVSNNLTLDDIENLTVSGEITTDSLTTDMVTANEAITAPMIIAGSASEDDSTVAVLIHDKGVGIKPTYSVDYNNNPPITYYCEEENYYATKGYVNSAIAGGGGIITIGSPTEASYVLDGKEFTKEIWQGDGGMAMHLVKSFGISISYYDAVKEANGEANIMGLCLIIYIADPENGDMAMIIDYRSTKQYTFMVDTVEGTMILLEAYYAWENPEFNS